MDMQNEKKLKICKRRIVVTYIILGISLIMFFVNIAVLKNKGLVAVISGLLLVSSTVAIVLLDSRRKKINQQIYEINKQQKIESFVKIITNPENKEVKKDIKCEYCGSVYSINLEGCPNCGSPRKK